MISEEKQKALEAALGNIEKQFGKGSVMKLRWCSQGTYRGDLRTGVQW